MFAAQDGHVDIVQLLIHAKADVDHQNYVSLLCVRYLFVESSGVCVCLCLSVYPSLGQSPIADGVSRIYVVGSPGGLGSAEYTYFNI